MKDSLTDKVEEAFDLYIDENLDWVKTEWGLWEDKDVDIAWILKEFDSMELSDLYYELKDRVSKKYEGLIK